MKTTRRNFVKTTGLVTGAACLGMSGICSCSMMEGISDTPSIPASAIQLNGNKLTILLDGANGLKEPGGKGKLSLKPDNNAENELKLIVIHPEAGTYLVFEDHCTHGGRELNYKHQSKQLICSSFGHSKYNLSGEVLSGPAEGDLKTFHFEKTGDRLVIDI